MARQKIVHSSVQIGRLVLLLAMLLGALMPAAGVAAQVHAVSSGMLLDVRYVDQVYVQKQPEGKMWNDCGPASAAMVFHYEGKEARDVLVDPQPTLDLVPKVKPGGRGAADLSMLLSTFKAYGLDAAVKWNPSLNDLRDSIQRGHPVLMAITEADHILVVVGVNDDGTVVVNDPFGGKSWWNEDVNSPLRNDVPWGNFSAPRTKGQGVQYQYSSELHGSYGIFINGTSSRILAGDGAPTEPIRQAFFDAYNRVGGSANIVELTNAVHTWGQSTANGNMALTQNFRESAAWSGGIGSIIYNPGDGKAYVLHGSIEDVYANAGGPLGAWVGYPTSDETTINNPAYYDFDQGGAINFFEHGFIAQPRGAAGFEMHTYYPSVDAPQVTATLLAFPRVRLDVTAHFERAPGYPDATDAVAINLVWAADGTQQSTVMQVVDAHTAQASIEVNLHQPIAFAIELSNFSHNTTKRGSYPVAFAADHATTRTMAARYRLGDPPTQHGEYWNRWDLDIAAQAAAHNLPPALLKAVVAHESAGLGTRGGDPALAYLYEPMVDASIQGLLSASWARPWTLPNNQPAADLRPCAAVIPGGYNLPAGATVSQLIDTWSACTNRWSRPQTNFVAQYRIAASYGLAQFVYRWHWDKLAGATPETLYDPLFSIGMMAQKIGGDRDQLSPALTASSTNVADWAAVLTRYNGSLAYPPRVYAWYNGQGAASVQPIVAVVYDADATALPALLASAASERRQAAAARASGVEVVAQITADVVGDGKPRLITLEQATTRDGDTTAVARVHKGTAPDSPTLYATSVITGVYGLGGLEVATPAAPGQPLLLVETPVGPHTLVTRIFTVRNGKLRELAPDVANSALPGFLTDRAPVQIGNDGTVFATVEGDPGHRVTTVYRPTSRGYARDRVVDLGPADTTFAISDNDRGADRSDQLRLVNRATGATTLIGDTGAADIEGLTFKPGSDVLYATSGDRLGVLSLTTGAFNPLTATFGKGHGALGALTFRNVNTVAFEPATGKLYGVRHRPRAQEQDLLFQIDPTTGAVIPDAFGSGQDYIAIGGPGVPEDISAIAFDPTSGQLYGVSGDDGDGGVLVTIDKLTGSGRIVGPLGVADVEGLAFLDDGALYVSTGDKDAGSQGRIYRLDQSTGGTTLVSAFVGGRDYEAIAGRARTEMPIDG